jgi:hypothetical protein
MAAVIRDPYHGPIITNNQNNPNNMFKDFYQREDSRRSQLKAYGQGLKDDIEAKKRFSISSAQEKFNNDRDYIQGKVNDHTTEQARANANKKTSKMQLCNDLDDQRRVKEDQHNKRFHMTEAEKRINGKNLEAYHNQAADYHGVLPGWRSNGDSCPEHKHAKVFSDIHSIPRVNRMEVEHLKERLEAGSTSPLRQINQIPYHIEHQHIPMYSNNYNALGAKGDAVDQLIMDAKGKGGSALNHGRIVQEIAHGRLAQEIIRPSIPVPQDHLTGVGQEKGFFSKHAGRSPKGKE